MTQQDISRTCCFIGHRKIEETPQLTEALYAQIEELIVNKNVNVFLFGSKSNFDSLCLQIVTELKEKYPHISRIYVRAEFPFISEDYRNYLLIRYDDTYYPEKMIKAGKASYVERNQEIINNSLYCICYYDKDYAPPKRKVDKHNMLPAIQPKSGTAIAYEYAVKKKKEIINFFKD